MLENKYIFGKMWIPITILVCMCVVVSVSIIFFQNQSIRLDESQSIWQSSHSPIDIINLIGQDVHVPLYPILLHLWIVAFGNSIELVRMLSLFFFLASIPIFYLLGRRVYSRDISLFATVLFSISPFMNWYANEARMYSLFTLVVLLSSYFFLGILDSDSKSSWAGFLISSLVGIYTHYFFLLFLFSCLVFYLFNQKLFSLNSRKKFIMVGSLIFIAFVPWVVYVFLLGKVSNSTPSLLVPTSVDLFNTFSQFLIGFQNDFINTIFLSLWPALTLLAFLALRRGSGVDSKTIYLITVFFMPIAISLFVSVYFRPIFLARYLIFTLPFLYLLLSWFFYRYPRRLMTFFSFSVALILIFGLVNEGASDTVPTKEDYRDVVKYLEVNAKPTDVIVVSAPFTIYPILYYYRGASTITTLPIWDQNKVGPIPSFSMEKLPKEVDSIRGSHSYVWVLLSYDQGYSENIRMYFDTHFEKTQTKIFSPGLILYEYKLRYI